MRPSTGSEEESRVKNPKTTMNFKWGPKREKPLDPSSRSSVEGDQIDSQLVGNIHVDRNHKGFSLSNDALVVKCSSLPHSSRREQYSPERVNIYRPLNHVGDFRRNSFNYREDQIHASSSARRRKTLPERPQVRFANIDTVALHSCSFCRSSYSVDDPMKRFTCSELRTATDNFSQNSFLVEGRSGYVYKGMLSSGQAVVVKTILRTEDSDAKFDAEVGILTWAKHPNVVALLGHCTEDRWRMLVYNYACNGSLDWHLSSRNPNIAQLGWSVRQRIAIQVAKALRYLHEECPTGRIVHCDVRSDNIFLTHQHVSMLGGFGSARWLSETEIDVDLCDSDVINGYMASDCLLKGQQLTEKIDVYGFGVILLELITGRKAYDPSRPKEEQLLAEWARPMLDDFEKVIDEMLDPHLEGRYVHSELYCMKCAAALCIQQAPSSRPQISKILQILAPAKEEPEEMDWSPPSVINQKSLRIKKTVTFEQPPGKRLSPRKKRSIPALRLSYDELVETF